MRFQNDKFSCDKPTSQAPFSMDICVSLERQELFFFCLAFQTIPSLQLEVGILVAFLKVSSFIFPLKSAIKRTD